ncbi:MAG: transcriptional repressor LexA [Clostridiales bacterium]|nr:transcriptional repressor LexA [Clostridiales bacterium]
MVNRIRKELTKRQARVLRAIESFVLERGFPPTIRELGRRLGIANPSAVFKHILSLERKGYLRREAGELRLAGFPAPLDNQIRVPLVGVAPAGRPEEVFESLGENVEVPEWMVGRRRGNIFCIRVIGKSMVDAYIDDGDRVLLERTTTANSGEMVVARLDDGSVTLKRLRRENGRILLVSENPEYKPIEVKELRVVGRVIGLLRKY